ncbi:ATP-grasp domain-containing protein [Streptomyces sp. CB03234]|uniref:ATP-grasp domain-containing protein n=1 Tax=Streptomyces sp. (strain CB03234) TaxID=1703937 RepID=UPI00093EE9BF|nr:ATP-grasp domain-containing protein [Streptomyces sp. CB03234]
MTTASRPPRRLAFLESNLTGTGMRALRQAVAMGLSPVFVTSDPARYDAEPQTARAIRETSEQILVCDTQDPETIAKTLLTALGPGGSSQDAGLCGVMTVMEYYVPTAAAVAHRLGLPGIAPDAAARARDKLRTRTACAEHGVAVPGFRFVRSTDEIDSLLEEIPLPCVVKPIDESASIGVRICHTIEQLAQGITEIAQSPVNSKGQPRIPGALVEECVFGHEVSVETFTFAGRTTVLGVTDKLLGTTPHFVELGHTFPSTVPHAQQAADLALAALDAIGFDFGPAHTEVKLTPRGPVLIEINARTGGDFIPDLVEQALGIPLLEQSIVAHSGGTPDLTPTRSEGAAIRFLAGRDGVVAQAPDLTVMANFPSVVSYHSKAQPGRTTRYPHNSHERLGHVLTRAATASLAAAEADAALCHLAPTYR